MLMATGYIFLGKSSGLEPEILDIWSGLATELLGAWVVARFVEFAIRKNSEHDKVRIRVARNLRYYPNIVTRIIEFNHWPDIRLIQKERNWSKGFYNKNRKYFAKDEIIDLDNAYNSLDELISILIERAVTEEEMTEKLANYEELSFKAECNIFEETPEIL